MGQDCRGTRRGRGLGDPGSQREFTGLAPASEPTVAALHAWLKHHLVEEPPPWPRLPPVSASRNTVS